MKEGRRPGFFGLLCSCFNLGSKKRSKESSSIQKSQGILLKPEVNLFGPKLLEERNEKKENAYSEKKPTALKEEVEEIKIRRAASDEQKNRESLEFPKIKTEEIKVRESSLPLKENHQNIPESPNPKEQVQVHAQEESIIISKENKPVSRQKLPSMARSVKEISKNDRQLGTNKKRRVYSARHISKKGGGDSVSFQSEERPVHAGLDVKVSKFSESRNIFFDNSNEILKIPFLENVDPIIIDAMDFKGSPKEEPNRGEINTNHVLKFDERHSVMPRKSSPKSQNKKKGTIFTDESRKAKLPKLNRKKHEYIPVSLHLKASSPTNLERPATSLSKIKKESSITSTKKTAPSAFEKNKGRRMENVENRKRPETSEGHTGKKKLEKNKQSIQQSNQKSRNGASLSAEKAKPYLQKIETEISKSKKAQKKLKRESSEKKMKAPAKSKNSGKKKPKPTQPSVVSNDSRTENFPPIARYNSHPSDDLIIIEDFSINERDSKEDDSMYFGQDRVDMSQEEYIPRSKNYELFQENNKLSDDEEDSLNDRSELSEKNDIEFKKMMRQLNADLVVSEPIIQVDFVWEPNAHLIRRKSF